MTDQKLGSAVECISSYAPLPKAHTPEEQPSTQNPTSSTPQRQPFAGLMAMVENMPMPTDEEIAEADAILAQAEREFMERSRAAREREAERRLLAEHIKPHLIDLTHDIPEPIPVIDYRGVCIASEGNISAVVGQAKSKKTFLCSMLVGELLRRGNSLIERNQITAVGRILWVDTEQAEIHVRRVTKRIHRLANLPDDRNSFMMSVLSLREIPPIMRTDILYKAIEYYKPKLVVVDGISDLMHNVNDIEESERTVANLMRLSTEHACHIMTVLHTNPNSDKARGHVGSTLCRKAETVMYVHKVGECSVVEPQYCRNEPFESFAFAIDEEGLPYEAPMPLPSEEAGDLCAEIMRSEYPHGVERAVLTERLVNNHGLAVNTARVRISRSIKAGYLRSDGNNIFLNQ